MNATTIYENTVKMLYTFDKVNGGGLAEKVISRPTDFENIGENIPSCGFYAAAAKVLLSALADMDKSNAKTSRLSAVKRFVKSGCKSYNDSLHGIFKNGEKYCLCDGYRFARLNSDIASVEHVDTTRCTVIDLAKVTPQIWKYTEVKAPALSAVKDYEKRAKAKQKATGSDYPISYEIVPGVFVNPSYLADMLEILDGARVYVEPENPRTMVYFKAENGEDGVLLPVNPKGARTL